MEFYFTLGLAIGLVIGVFGYRAYVAFNAKKSRKGGRTVDQVLPK